MGCGASTTTLPTEANEATSNAEEQKVVEGKIVPSYWSGKPSLNQGFRAELVSDEQTLDALKSMLFVPDPMELASGRECQRYPRDYREGSLQFYCAWRIENPDKWQIYSDCKRQLANEVSLLRTQAVPLKPIDIILPGRDQMPGGLDKDASETFLLSGTKPEYVLPILSQGFSIDLAAAKGLFGAGIYFAEDVTKIDQYTAPDFDYKQDGVEDLHSRLFGAGHHPGSGIKGSEADIFYCLVVRTILGWYQRTSDGKTNLDYPDMNVFHDMNDQRELSEIPDSDPPQRYHSLVAQAGPKSRVKRFREFMIYNSNQSYVEYIIAYHRISPT
jgi:hypothetical protein